MAAILSAAALSTAGEVRGREFPGLSYRGPSGLVLVPTGQIIRHNWMGFGIHRGVIKVSYGLADLAEIGLASPDVYEDPNREDWRRETTGFLKLASPWGGEDWGIPGFAMGAENSPRGSQETYYGAGTWHGKIAGWPFEITLGYGNGRFCERIFGGLGLIPVGILGRTVKLLGEYAGEDADLGLRLALSKSLRLDFVLLIDAAECHEVDQTVWHFRIDRGLPGASMAAHIGRLKRMIIPEKKKKK